MPKRVCHSCYKPLSAARLKAVPDATICVACLEAAGDVDRIKRYDDYTNNGEEKEEIFFTKPDQYLDTVLQRNGKMAIHKVYLPPSLRED